MKAAAEYSSDVQTPEQTRSTAESRPARTFAAYPGWLKAGFCVCVVIAVAVVIRRMIVLSSVSSVGGPPEMSNLDAWFKSHAVLTWVHITAALAFVLLLPIIFRLRPEKAGTLQSAFFVLGAITGATAYGMSRYAVGGWLERSAVLVFDTLFLLSLAKAYQRWREGDAIGRRIWMTRAVAVLLGIASTRPVMAVFFATERLTHLTTSQFFGIAFWIGFSINTIVIELWLRSVIKRSNVLS
ncbi:DUF2306 domain-containing protein [Occallatibacter savannae]|uniref:DUF2306 domain-containing protein n=1 Tax=Occallatibacter savannae TaxID=1002691 RepID=UPI001EF40822|nr:DUF2306 domain-containing protein [Occallatibacter savannae]